MKISNSKQQLAKIISENGGWRNGAEWAAQDKGGKVFFYGIKPTPHPRVDGWGFQGVMEGYWIARENALPNWHQTILSRAEYLHLYQAPDADGWIEWKGGERPVDDGDLIDVKFSDGDALFGVDSGWDWGEDAGVFNIIAYRLHKPEQQLGELCDKATGENKHEHVEVKPTIEQLSDDYLNAKDYADRKQQEADAAKADAKSKLDAMVAAGKALGLLVSPINEKQEPEMVITDWRDLRVGDEIEYLGGTTDHWIGRHGAVALIDHNEDDQCHILFQDGQERGDDAQDDPRTWKSTRWCDSFRFIRRP